MADCPKSIPAPPPFDDLDGWRRIYLHRLRPADRETLSALSRLLMELCFESATLASDAGLIVPSLRAAVADLRHLGAFLGTLAEYQREQTAEPECVPLAIMAERLAPRVGELAAEIESALPVE